MSANAPVSATLDAARLHEHFENVSVWLGADPNLIYSFLEGDDWSLVIRATAVTEAALDSAIAAAIGHDVLKDSIAQIPLAALKFGKLALAVKLGIIDKEDEKAARALCELRNRLAHGVRGIGFQFAKVQEHELEAFFKTLFGTEYVKSEELKEHRRKKAGFLLILRMGIIWGKCLVACKAAERDRLKIQTAVAYFEDFTREEQQQRPAE